MAQVRESAVHATDAGKRAAPVSLLPRAVGKDRDQNATIRGISLIAILQDRRVFFLVNVCGVVC